MEHAIFLLLYRFPRKTARRDPVAREWVLSYAWLWLLVPALVTGFSLFLAANPEIMNRPAGRNPARGPRQIPTGLVVVGSLGVALLGIGGLAEMIGTSVRLGEQTVVGHSPWRWPTTIRWDDLKRVTYSGRGDAMSLWGGDGARIKVSFMMSGMRTFRDELESRLAPSVFSQALPFFSAIGIRRLSDSDPGSSGIVPGTAIKTGRADREGG